MLRLQYDLGNSPINIYVDRPSHVLGQLSDINVNYFVIGKYEDKLPPNFRRVEYITPNIKPSIVLSQTKLQNFDILMNFAAEYKVPFFHFESMGIPQIYRVDLDAIKGVRANVNIFADISLVREWEFDEAECLVIPNGVKPSFPKNEKLYYISNDLPVMEMAKGICPIALKTNVTSYFIQNTYNGFLYEKESDISIIINRLSKMDECDVRKIGENARNTVMEKFPYDPFINSWKKILRSVI